MGVGTALAFIGGSDFVRAAGGSPFAQGLYGGLATAGGGVALAVVPLLRRAARLAGAVRERDRRRRGSRPSLLAAAPRVSAIRRATARSHVRSACSRATALLCASPSSSPPRSGSASSIGNWVVTLLERDDRPVDGAGRRARRG